ncbi:uncharacterized protein [Oscarella lobularis]|uniref:uncharacterized protein n=1 Tax=Oscarella lobularis TaxID=121494 RepID=UPI0033132E78
MASSFVLPFVLASLFQATFSTILFQKSEDELTEQCCSGTTLTCSALGSFDPDTGLAHLPNEAEVFCADRLLWKLAGESLGHHHLLENQCALTPESFVSVQSTQQRNLISNECSLSNQTDILDHVSRLFVICKDNPVYPNVSLILPNEADDIRNESCSNSSLLCDCLRLTAAKWLAQKQINQNLNCGDPNVFPNDQTNLVWTAGTRQCLGTNESPCHHGVWKVVLEWEFDLDMDLSVRTPEDCVASSSVECKDCFLPVCLDSTGALANGGKNDNASDGTGREVITISNGDHADFDSFFHVRAAVYYHHLPLNSNATATLLFNDFFLAAIQMNVDEDDIHFWETFNIFAGKGTYVIKDSLSDDHDYHDFN